MVFAHRPRTFITFLCMLLGAACATPASQHRSSFVASAHHQELAHATIYGTAPEPDALRGEAADAFLAAALSEGCEDNDLAQDGRLADIALAVARASEGGRKPPNYALVSYHAHRTGLPEPTPQLWLTSGPDTRSIASALKQAVRDAAATSRLTHCGAAAVRHDGAVVVALALSTRVFSLRAGVARATETGSVLRFEGTLARGYRDPALAVTAPDGSVTRRALGSGSSFSHALPTKQEGEYTLELLANGPEGLTVVAMFPVAVGVPLVTRAPEIDDEPVENDAGDVAERLAQLIAKERASRGLSPLKIDRRLKRIAQAHCEDMLHHRFIAHSSPRTGDAPSRVQSAGLDAMVVLENIGRGYSASELHRGLMESPGHRGNILHPEAREIGIGVVAEREGERLAFITTELFTQLARP